MDGMDTDSTGSGAGGVGSKLPAEPAHPEQVERNYGPGGDPYERAQGRADLQPQSQPDVEDDQRQQEEQKVGSDPSIRSGHFAAILA